MDLAELPISLPWLIGISVVWLAIGIFFSVQYAWRRALSVLLKLCSTLGFLLIWPIYFPIWMLVNALRRQKENDLSLGQAIKEQLRFRRQEDIVEEDDSFVLYDTNGKSLADRIDARSSSKGAQGLLRTRDIVQDAVTQTASDILIHPVSDSEFSVRFRVNGGLRNVQELSDAEGKSVVNCIKAISGMDIADRRRPQDGGFTARTRTGSVSFRVATAGVLNGEKVSIRVLDQSATAFTLKTVGMADSEQSSVKSALAGHSGMILVCGPTGSGKSSTVHAMLRTIDSVERNVITIEDPIEYVLPNASQIEINTRAGITFASVLRSVLRQDPDVISVGEIRDQETAEIALQAAQTGHLVFATVHSGSNEAALLRLIDLGCDPKLIASAINVVLSQRLVRRLCDHCKSRPTYSEAQRAALWKQQVDPECLFGPAGCEHCQQSGFSSRTGVFDIMPMDQALRARLSSGDLHDTTGGRMTRMQVRATQLALTGIIPWEEVLKVSASVE